MIKVFLEDGYYIQTQISDFDTISPSAIHNCKSFDIWFAKKKRKGIKTRIVLRLNKIFQDIKKGIQRKLSDFQNLSGKIRGRVHQYIPNLKTPICKLTDGCELSKIEKFLYSNYSNYKGDLRHLFLFYDWNTSKRNSEKIWYQYPGL